MISFSFSAHAVSMSLQKLVGQILDRLLKLLRHVLGNEAIGFLLTNQIIELTTPSHHKSSLSRQTLRTASQSVAHRFPSIGGTMIRTTLPSTIAFTPSCGIDPFGNRIDCAWIKRVTRICLGSGTNTFARLFSGVMLPIHLDHDSVEHGSLRTPHRTQSFLTLASGAQAPLA